MTLCFNGYGVLHRISSKFHRLCRMMKKTSVPNLDFFRPSVFELCNFLWFQFPIDFVHGWILAPCQFHKFDQICEKTQYTKTFFSMWRGLQMNLFFFLWVANWSEIITIFCLMKFGSSFKNWRLKILVIYEFYCVNF